MTTDLVPSYLDVTRLAARSFLARYREPNLTAYTQDLKAYPGWCQTYDRDPPRVTRGELEKYVRHLQGRGYAAATVAAGSAPWRPSTCTPSSTASSRSTPR